MIPAERAPKKRSHISLAIDARVFSLGCRCGVLTVRTTSAPAIQPTSDPCRAIGSFAGLRIAMKGYRDIKRLLVEELGFRDLRAYKRWATEVWPGSHPTTQEIERLSPDAVDCRAFWKVCDELFGSDPVCNVALEPEVGLLPYAVDTPMDANRLNLRFSKELCHHKFSGGKRARSVARPGDRARLRVAEAFCRNPDQSYVRWRRCRPTYLRSRRGHPRGVPTTRPRGKGTRAH